MKLLLDTHIWIWAVSDPEKISPRVAAEMTSEKNDLWLSPISIWEYLLLVKKGRMTIHNTLEHTIQEFLGSLPLKEAPLTNEVALELRQFELDHGDPSDRFLVATARIYGLTLVTADERLKRAPGISVLPNR